MFAIRIKKGAKDKPKTLRGHVWVDKDLENYTTFDKAAVFDTMQKAQLEVSESWETVVEIERENTSLNDKLDEFLNLKTGWDGYDGSPINAKAIAKAKEIVDIMPGNWQAVPCPSSGVQIEQHDNGYDIEIYIGVI